MAMLSLGGIDVSKHRLDVMLLPEGECASVSNDAAGWAKLVKQLRGSSIAAIGIEASGGYERGVIRALMARCLGTGSIRTKPCRGSRSVLVLPLAVADAGALRPRHPLRCGRPRGSLSRAQVRRRLSPLPRARAALAL